MTYPFLSEKPGARHPAVCGRRTCDALVKRGVRGSLADRPPAAMGAARSLTQDGLFIGQSPEFFAVIRKLAKAADAGRP